MSLEALVGGKITIFIWLPYLISDLHIWQLLPSLDVSDRYSNLKASWDSLMEAASHGSPWSFQVAVTVVLE
jgi:hypothetical protein